MLELMKVNKRRFVFLATTGMMLSVTAGLCGCASSRAISLTVGEGLVEPVGFNDSTPAFSWKLPDDVVRQTAYQIEVTKAGVPLWDSGWIESDRSVVDHPHPQAPADGRLFGLWLWPCSDFRRGP